jgi:hypothetical protein
MAADSELCADLSVTLRPYETGGKKFPRLQILTAAEILDHRPQVRFGFTEGFRKASRKSEEKKVATTPRSQP